MQKKRFVRSQSRCQLKVRRCFSSLPTNILVQGCLGVISFKLFTIASVFEILDFVIGEACSTIESPAVLFNFSRQISFSRDALEIYLSRDALGQISFSTNILVQRCIGVIFPALTNLVDEGRMTGWTMTYLKIRKHYEWFWWFLPQFKGKTKMHCYSFQKGKQGSAKQQGEQGEWGCIAYIDKKVMHFEMQCFIHLYN